MADTALSSGPPAANTSRSTFSDLAEYCMRYLYAHHDDQVGRFYQGPDGVGKSRTDCITYVKQVIAWTYDYLGAKDVAASVRTYTGGIELAKFLVSQKWKAYYWNPDVNDRTDNNEHFVAYRIAVRSRSYYNVPVSGVVVDYRITHGFWDSVEEFVGYKAPRPDGTASFKALAEVPFAYGLARGAKHTFLLSRGNIFEVHWDQIGSSLYEQSPLYTFGWLDGIFLLPPGVILRLL